MSTTCCRCAFLLHLLYGVWSKGSVSLTFNENPIYNDSQLNITCSFARNYVLSTVIVDAFNGTRKGGSLNCSVVEGTTSATGVFSGSDYVGCPNFVSRSGHVSILMPASPTLELQYKCTVKVNDGSAFYNWTSDSAQLRVKVLPSAPKFATEHLVYNEKDNMTVVCESHSGTPSADLDLTVRTTNGELIASSSGRGSVQLILTALRSYHNAVAMCVVTNHVFPNMTVKSPIIVNHIACVRTMPVKMSTYSSSKTFNCSAEIVVFPEAFYNWSFSTETHTSTRYHHNSSTLTVLQGHSGTFYCTATNTITLETVLVTYVAISEPQINDKELPNNALGSRTEWLTPTVVITILIMISLVISVILYEAKLLQKRGNCMMFGISKASPQLNENTCNIDDEVHMVDSDLYEPWNAQPADGLECNDRRCKSSSISQCESAILTKYTERKGDMQLQNREDSSVMRKPSRLLIAAEGAAANVKHRLLPTTVLVEYCDQSCSLESIVEKVTEASSMPSHPAFQSLALLLRRATVGAILSDLDRSVLTSKTVNGKTLHDFFMRLTDVSLDKLASSTRIDILNYGSSDAAQLAIALTNRLKVPVTVSDDLFGLNTATRQEGECDARVADDYFYRHRLDEVVYADVEASLIQQRLRPQRKVGQVLYSDVVLKA